MRKPKQAVIELAVSHAKEKRDHVIVGWPHMWSMRGSAEAFPVGKHWPGSRKRDKFRAIACIVKPDGEIVWYQQ